MTLDEHRQRTGRSRLHRSGSAPVPSLILPGGVTASARAIGRGNHDISCRPVLAFIGRLPYGVLRGSAIAQAGPEAEPTFGTSMTRDIAAHRRAEMFFDL